MWPFKKPTQFKNRIEKIPWWGILAVILSFIGLAFSIGLTRWSWLLLDEQIELRKTVEELKNDQRQTAIQYEFWLQKLKKELEQSRAAKTR